MKERLQSVKNFGLLSLFIKLNTKFNRNFF